jgi:hypothetical protein
MKTFQLVLNKAWSTLCITIVIWWNSVLAASDIHSSTQPWKFKSKYRVRAAVATERASPPFAVSAGPWTKGLCCCQTHTFQVQTWPAHQGTQPQKTLITSLQAVSDLIQSINGSELAQEIKPTHHLMSTLLFMNTKIPPLPHPKRYSSFTCLKRNIV